MRGFLVAPLVWRTIRHTHASIGHVRELADDRREFWHTRETSYGIRRIRRARLDQGNWSIYNGPCRNCIGETWTANDYLIWRKLIPFHLFVCHSNHVAPFITLNHRIQWMKTCYFFFLTVALQSRHISLLLMTHDAYIFNLYSTKCSFKQFTSGFLTSFWHCIFRFIVLIEIISSHVFLHDSSAQAVGLNRHEELCFSESATSSTFWWLKRQQNAKL